MFKLYYPDAEGILVLQGDFATQQDAVDKTVIDTKSVYTIEQIINSEIVMVMSTSGEVC